MHWEENINEKRRKDGAGKRVEYLKGELKIKKRLLENKLSHLFGSDRVLAEHLWKIETSSGNALRPQERNL